MKWYFYTLVLGLSVTILLSSCGEQKNKPDASSKQTPDYVLPGETHFRSLKMLTEEGENAEAYFSFDEKKLVFQATFADLKCDQIFVMNIDGTGKKMVSTGKGRTTCSFFLPGDTTIIYASTHLASDECPPPPDRSKGYVWQLYDSYDIFMADLNGNIIKQLTNTPGYDAEA
ncbi:MAG: hypothetical protein D6748_12685, partial [Calditrichaeota bacterium]